MQTVANGTNVTIVGPISDPWLEVGASTDSSLILKSLRLERLTLRVLERVGNLKGVELLALGRLLEEEMPDD